MKTTIPRVYCSAVVIALQLLLAAPSHAEPSWLRWQAPPDCPDVRGAARATSERLGREPSPDEIQAVGVVEPTHDGHRLRLDLVSGGKSQSLELVSPDCASLTDAAGLVIATSIDPSLGATDPVVPEPEPEPEQEPEPEPSVPPEPEPPVASERNPRSAPESPSVRSQAPPIEGAGGGPEGVSLSVLGGAEIGMLPRVTGGPRLRLELLWSRWRLGVGGSYLAPQVVSNTVGSARIQAGVADVRACGRLRWSRAELPLCGAFELGGTHAQGLREPGRRSAQGPRLAVVASAAPRVRLSPRVGAIASVEVAFAPIRTEFVVQDPEEPAVVFGPSALSGRVWLGVEVVLGTWR